MAACSPKACRCPPAGDSRSSTKRTRNDPGTNRRGSNEELVVAEIGQVGTQFDTFSHQMIGGSMYNCVTLEEAASRTGFSKLGVEQVGALVTRGVLHRRRRAQGRAGARRDRTRSRRRICRPRSRAQKLTLQPGDAVLIHTGWGTLWGKDNARYQRVEPGLGVAAAEWLAKQDPMLVGADNSAVEVSPNPDKNLAGPGHQIFLVVNGIHLLENLRLDELAAREAHEFALIVEPLKIQGRHRIDGGADRDQIAGSSRARPKRRVPYRRAGPSGPADDRWAMNRLLIVTASTPKPIRTKPTRISMIGPLKSSPNRSVMNSTR